MLVSLVVLLFKTLCFDCHVKHLLKVFPIFFVSVEEIESYVHIETGEKVILSPQQISSCAKNGYGGGGRGGKGALGCLASPLEAGESAGGLGEGGGLVLGEE